MDIILNSSFETMQNSDLELLNGGAWWGWLVAGIGVVAIAVGIAILWPISGPTIAASTGAYIGGTSLFGAGVFATIIGAIGIKN